MRYITNTFTLANSGTKSTVAIDISAGIAASAQAVFTDAAAAGTLKFQVSNDPPASTGSGGPPTPTTWIDLSGSSVSVASGAATLLPKVDVAYNWIRVTFVSSAGAGTIAVSVKTNGY